MKLTNVVLSLYLVIISLSVHYTCLGIYLHQGYGVYVVSFKMPKECAKGPLVAEVFNVWVVALDVVGVIFVDAEIIFVLIRYPIKGKLKLQKALSIFN